MKVYYLLPLLFFIVTLEGKGQDKELSDILAIKYCKALTGNDTVTKANFENVLPKLDEEIVFGKGGFLPLIVQEVTEKDTTFNAFYTTVYNKFSNRCPAYQRLYGLDTTVELRDPSYFINNYCECFNEETKGEIENDDLSSVLKTCNEKFNEKRKYKRKVRRELRKSDLSRKEFSEYITARFLTECDLIVDHFFSLQADYLARNTELMLKKIKGEEN